MEDQKIKWSTGKKAKIEEAKKPERLTQTILLLQVIRMS